MALRALDFLLVEDNDDHAYLAQRSLKKTKLDHRVDRVADGAAALAYLRQETPYENKQRPDLVLLDLKLPKIDGHQVLQQIKQDPNLCRIPVIILSTSEEEQDRVKAHAYHANGYLIKPLDLVQLDQVLETLKPLLNQ